jgi:hypothetical protein
MARKTQKLLEAAGILELNVVGNAVPGDSYWGYTDGLHTIAIYARDFTGRIKIQGTLATHPHDDDWFDVLIGGFGMGGNPYKDYVKFTGVEGWTFTANLVFLRATIDRDILGVTNVSQAGCVEKILLNY